MPGPYMQQGGETFELGPDGVWRPVGRDMDMPGPGDPAAHPGRERFHKEKRMVKAIAGAIIALLVLGPLVIIGTFDPELRVKFLIAWMALLFVAIIILGAIALVALLTRGKEAKAGSQPRIKVQERNPGHLPDTSYKPTDGLQVIDAKITPRQRGAGTRRHVN